LSEQKLRSQVIKKRIVKSILWIILTPIILLIVTIGLLHLPPIQNLVVDKITNYLTESTGYDTSIDYVNIRWFNSVVVDGTNIYDNDSVKMISVDEMVLTFNLKSLIREKDIELKEAWIDGADVNLRNADSIGLNIDEWAYKISQIGATNDTITGEPGFFGINKISLINSGFSISDDSRDSIDIGFDFNHFRLEDINADLLNLKSVKDTFQIDVRRLSTYDQKTGLEINQISTYFNISNKGMAFYDLDLNMGQTRVKDSVVFRFEKPWHMAYFIDSVDISANFNETILHSNELSLFAPELKSFNEQIELSGYFKGTVTSFYADNFNLKLGEHTNLNGSVEIDGLPKINEALFSIGLNNSSIKATDFENHLPDRPFQITNKLGLIKLDGRFDGFFRDFVTNGNFETEIGNFNSNTNLEISGNDIATYNGTLSLNDFDIGYFIEDSLYQNINMNGSIQGSGFTLEAADFLLDANISSVGINGYEYSNIVTDGRFAQSFFSGDLKVDDDNFILSANGSVDLRAKDNILNIEGTLLRANLDELNITSQETMIASDFKLDFTGIKLDSIEGAIELKNSYVKYLDQDLVIDSLFFTANRQNDLRSVNILSDFFDIDLLGNYEFSTILNELTSLNEQYKLIFTSKQDEVKDFLLNRNEPAPFDMKFNAQLQNISPLIHLFDTAIHVAPNSIFGGTFTNTDKENFSLNAKTDTLRYANIIFINNEFDINANDMRDSIKVLTLGYLYSEKQIYANTSETESLTIEAVWDGKHIDIVQNIGQESSGNYAEIGAGIDFYADRTELRFSESNLMALDKTWHISKDNVVVFGEKKIDIKDLNIFNSDQSIDLSGQISILNDSAKTLSVAFDNVGVENINSITDKNYSGIITGKIQAQNLYYNPLISGNLNIDQLSVNNVLVGDVGGSLVWNDQNKLFDLNFEVNRNGSKIIDLNGAFYPSNNTDQLDLKLSFDQASLDIAEPYAEEIFSEIDGTIDGEILVKGTLNAPLLDGNGIISNGEFRVNYLNTKYIVNGELELKKDLINFKAFNLTDLNQSLMEISGGIRHNAFKNIDFDLNGELNNFKVLNTDVELGDIYYGEAFATGSLNVSGEPDNLTIAANVVTQPNTKLYIPITENEALEEADFITFINRADTTSNDEEEVRLVEKVKVQGLNLDLDINVTPDAYTEIIIDAKTGDIIRGRGNGQLRLQIDSEGDFKMTGGLEITEGAYNFSLYNIITKEFNIEQPSKITWYGDPLAGIMDINASYSQNTSLTPLLNDVGFGTGDGTSSSTARRFPTKVLLRLNGELLSPQIDFDIDLSGVNTQDFQFQTAIDAFKNKIASDEQELNRQVLSLILLNRFSEQGNLNIGGQTATQNVSQLLSNQLSQFVTQLDENLEIDFDLADLSEEAFQTFQVRLAYTFLDGRLRVSREGGVTNLVDINSIAGDWAAEYLLTQDGRYKVKVYSRTNYDLATSAISTNPTSTTTGASITQTTSFNTISEFFNIVGKKRKEKRKKRREAKAAESNNGVN
jgi:translocation-and-assembly-module (TAM) inner membrane subunit TamB-like protein